MENVTRQVPYIHNKMIKKTQTQTDEMHTLPSTYFLELHLLLEVFEPACLRTY